MLYLGLHFTLYYFVLFLRFLAFNFFSVRTIFIRVNPLVAVVVGGRHYVL